MSDVRIVDRSHPARPGIVGPHSGGMEARQGCCELGPGQAPIALWECDTRIGSTMPEMQGRRQVAASRNKAPLLAGRGRLRPAHTTGKPVMPTPGRLERG